MTTDKDISEVTALVWDHRGLYLPIAHRMAKACKRVLHWSDYRKGLSSLCDALIGDGFDRVERCMDPWKIKNDVDLFIFPDVELYGEQLELESQGFAVWGSKSADSIELNREKFMGLLGKKGLDVAPHVIIIGLEALRSHLRDKTDKYIKISRWRGDMETHHWRSWKQDEGFLDHLAVRWGPAKELVRFLVFDNIETDLEIGGDTYSVRGLWPDLMLNGVEWKDQAYFGSVTEWEKMPEQIREVLLAFAEDFEAAHFSGQFSCEVRVQGDRSFFTDPTLRGGLPSTMSQLMLWKNFPEIVWAGANGGLVQPEKSADFSAECFLQAKHPKDSWTVIEIPDELRDNIGFSGACEIDGAICFPPDEKQGDDLGWLCAIENSPQATLKELGRLVGLLPDGVTAEFSALADIIKEIESAEDQGVPMTDKPLPDPAIVLESP